MVEWRSINFRQCKQLSPPSNQCTSCSRVSAMRKHKSVSSLVSFLPSPFWKFSPLWKYFQSINLRFWNLKMQNSLFYSLASKHKPATSCGAYLENTKNSSYPREKVVSLNSLTYRMSVSNRMPSSEVFKGRSPCGWFLFYALTLEFYHR